MGPIQSGMNQIIQNIMHGATMYAGGRAIKGVKEEVEQTREDLTELFKEKSKSASESLKKGDVNRHLEEIQPILNNPKKAEEFFKNNPEYAEMLIGKDAQKATDDYINNAIKAMKEKFNIQENRQNESNMNLETWGQNLLNKLGSSNESIGNEKAAERVTDMIRQRSLFEGNKKAIENPVNFTKNIQLPSSINKKIKQTSLNNGMPNIKHRNVGEK